MRKFTTTLCLALAAGISSVRAQTTLYSQNFNTGSASEWTLNTTDLGGDNSLSLNYWIINNVFTGAPPFIANTPDQPAGITGNPQSYYMHISSAFGAGLGAENCSFQTQAGAHSFFAAQNTAITTTGYTNVNISFWWLCSGNASAVGQLYYRTSSGGSWMQVSTASTPAAPRDSFNMTSTWTQYSSVHLADFDNQAFLEFGFRFKHGGSGNDPAFGIDEIEVKGTPASSVPTPTFTMTPNPVCQDSCITFTNTTSGAIDSFRWKIVGAPYTANTSPYQLCIPSAVPAGTYVMRLYVFLGGAVDSTDQSFTVNPAPHPVINQTGHTLSVTGAYTGYQWVKAGTPITGATNSSYTYTVSASYTVIVDSNGCKGTSTALTPVATNIINGVAQNYWVSQNGNNIISLFAASPLSEALTVTVFDATGRSIHSEVWAAGSIASQINAGFYPPGTYIIRLSNQNTAAVLRWLKQ